MPDDSFQQQMEEVHDCFVDLFMAIAKPICIPICEFLTEKIKKIR